MADTAFVPLMPVANSSLVDTSHISIINEDDCGTTKSWTIDRNEKGREKYFGRRILGRVLAADVINPSSKKVIAKKGDLVDHNLLEVIENSEVKAVEIRSPLVCKAKVGLCQQCYGWDLSTRKLVDLGIPVGVIAAQSVGEPGTQLTASYQTHWWSRRC